jgi:hypothetical protein
MNAQTVVFAYAHCSPEMHMLLIMEPWHIKPRPTIDLFQLPIPPLNRKAASRALSPTFLLHHSFPTFNSHAERQQR